MNIREIASSCEWKAKYCWERMVAYFRSNRIFLLFASGVILCSYSYELFNQTLSIDDEKLIWINGPMQDWLTQGRWGMYLICCIFPNPCIPFAGLFLTLILNALAFLVIFDALGKNSSCKFLLFPLFITAPIMYFVYTFNSLLPGIGIGTLCAALAVRLAKEANSRWYLLFPAVLLGAFAISCYQAFVNVLMLLSCIFLIDDFIFSRKNMPDIAKQLVFFLLFGIGSLLLYYTIDQSIIKINGFLRPYLSKFSISINIFRSPDAFFHFVWNVYKGSGRIYGAKLISQGILFIGCTGIAIGRILFLRIPWWRKGIFLVLVGSLIFIPFSLCLILNFWEMRGAFAFIWVIPFLFFLAWRVSPFVLRFLLAGTAIACIFQYLFVNNKLAYSNKLSFERDRTLSVRILSRIDQLLVNSNLRQEIPLMIVGMPNSQFFPRGSIFENVGMIGSSFYQHRGGDAERIACLLSCQGNSRFLPASIKERTRIMRKAVSLPDFPAPGSIALLDGVVVVKLSPPTYFQCRETKLKCSLISQNLNVIEDYHTDLTNWRPIYRVSENNVDFSHEHLAVEKTAPGTIRLHITGNDPQFILRKIPVSPSKEYLMAFVFDSDGSDELHLFYQNTAGDSFSDERIVRLKIDQGKNRFILRVPGRILSFPLRVDPGSGGAKHIVIKKIAVLERNCN